MTPLRDVHTETNSSVVPAMGDTGGDTHELADRLAEAVVRLEADDRPTIKAASNFLRAAIQLLQDT